jgi:hypothetical protein
MPKRKGVLTIQVLRLVVAVETTTKVCYGQTDAVTAGYKTDSLQNWHCLYCTCNKRRRARKQVGKNCTTNFRVGFITSRAEDILFQLVDIQESLGKGIGEIIPIHLLRGVPQKIIEEIL